MEELAEVDSHKLMQAWTAVVAAVGVDAPTAEALQLKIKEEEARRTAKVQPLVLLKKTQRRLQQLVWRADRTCKEVEALEEQRSKLHDKIAEVKSRGRDLEQQIVQAETIKKGALEAMSGLQAAPWGGRDSGQHVFPQLGH